MSYNLYQSNRNLNLPNLFVNGIALTNLKLLNTTIRKAFVKELYPFSPKKKSSVFQYFPKMKLRNNNKKEIFNISNCTKSKGSPL